MTCKHFFLVSLLSIWIVLINVKYAWKMFWGKASLISSSSQVGGSGNAFEICNFCHVWGHASLLHLRELFLEGKNENEKESRSFIKRKVNCVYPSILVVHFHLYTPLKKLYIRRVILLIYPLRNFTNLFTLSKRINCKDKMGKI